MSLLEQFLPNHQFSERHQATVRCRPGELLDIIQNFQPPRDRAGDVAMILAMVRRASPGKPQSRRWPTWSPSIRRARSPTL